MSRFTRMVHRVDANQKTIIAALVAVGATVESLGGKGIPDLLVGYLDRNYLLEVKRGRARLNADQSNWHASWCGEVAVVRTVSEALRAIGFPLFDELDEES